MAKLPEFTVLLDHNKGPDTVLGMIYVEELGDYEKLLFEIAFERAAKVERSRISFRQEETSLY